MSMRMRWMRVWLALGFVGCGVLLYACLMPHPPQVGSIPHFDKLEHFLAYVVLGAWFAEILSDRRWWVFIGLTVFGLLIEVAQSMTTYRSPNVWDLVADVSGIVAGMTLAWLGAMRWLDYIDRHALPKRNGT